MNTQQPSGFYGMGIAPKILETLDRLKFTEPTPIQKQSIPIALEGKDIIGIAQTGTGKTLAYTIPALQRIAKVGGKILIILPTRELALQVEETFVALRSGVPVRTAVLIGGAAMRPQIDALRRGPHAIIVTPGRLIDHLEQRTINLKDVSVLVLDEADRMLDMGFAPQINRILETVPKQRQTLLFSATMPPEIMRMAQKYMAMPVPVEIARTGTTAAMITQELFFVRREDKTRLLEKMLTEHKGTVLVFSRTKHGAHRIARSVKTMGHSVSEIHSDKSLNARREALEGFKRGKYRVLIATDIAARGIDVKNIELVINFDLPDHKDDYVHRIGRTGRAGSTGHAISFATPDQSRDVRDIERMMRIQIPQSKLPELPPHRVVNIEEIAQRAERSSSRGNASRPQSAFFGNRDGSRGRSGSYGRAPARSHTSHTHAQSTSQTNYTPHIGAQSDQGFSSDRSRPAHNGRSRGKPSSGGRGFASRKKW